MEILVINCGSSSIKADVIQLPVGSVSHSLRVERISSNPSVILDGNTINVQDGATYESILTTALVALKTSLGKVTLQGIGHRVVHGGNLYSQPVLIDEAVEKAIASFNVLAPLHNPVNLKGIQICSQVFTEIPQVAVFDTAFHRTLPSRAQYYAIDKTLTDKYDIRRYGFHGTSHQYVAEMAAKFLQTELRNLRLITCHLGNGGSITAVEFGRSVETSMGWTPLEGLVMGTRSGDVDPGVLLQLLKNEHWQAEDLDKMLNEHSGLAGLTGGLSDMRDIIAKAAQGDEACRLALQVVTHRLRKYIGAYAAVMGGVDAIVFTGGIGENSAEIRHRAIQRFDYLGAIIDEDLNRDIHLTDENNVAEFSASNSRVKLLAVKTDEQLAIAQESAKVIEEKFKVNTIPLIPIAISARHIHLCRETVDLLFGKGYELTVKNPLSQPGQFAANETLTIVGPKNKIEKVRILGPLRPKDQVEISRTDEFFLGIDAPVRESGQTENSPGITLIGPAGTTTIKEGVICAWRHIHMHTSDAAIFGVEDKDIVEVDVDDPIRPITFKNVLIRVSDKFKLEMHIDTDEGNAAEISNGESGTLNLTGKSCQLKKKRV
jgi:acetate kinase